MKRSLKSKLIFSYLAVALLTVIGGIRVDPGYIRPILT
jgi:hypothetical protein